jgi:hypothetical protein
MLPIFGKHKLFGYSWYIRKATTLTGRIWDLRRDVDEVPDQLPARVKAKIRELAKKTGVRPAVVIETALRLYERYVVEDPEKPVFNSEDRKVLARIMRRIGLRTPKEVLQERARAGAEARLEALTPAQRSAQAKKAAEARWKRGQQSPGGSQGKSD